MNYNEKHTINSINNLNKQILNKDNDMIQITTKLRGYGLLPLRRRLGRLRPVHPGPYICIYIYIYIYIKRERERGIYIYIYIYIQLCRPCWWRCPSSAASGGRTTATPTIGTWPAA